MTDTSRLEDAVQAIFGDDCAQATEEMIGWIHKHGFKNKLIRQDAVVGSLQANKRVKVSCNPFVDVHAETLSRPGRVYTKCVKCDSDQYLIKDIHWSAKLGGSRMGSWCLHCHVTYYDYAVMTGLRCCYPKLDGTECCSYLSESLECTKPENHGTAASFIIEDMGYGREGNRIRLFVMPFKHDAVTQISDPSDLLKGIGSKVWCFSLLCHLKSAYNTFYNSGPK